MAIPWDPPIVVLCPPPPFSTYGCFLPNMKTSRINEIKINWYDKTTTIPNPNIRHMLPLIHSKYVWVFPRYHTHLIPTLNISQQLSSSKLSL